MPGTTSSFYQRAGQYFVTTDGPDGQLHDYRIQYTFGVAPLQQYLIAMPGGRLQALSIAWDTRPREQGGQRWFHLYPGQAIKAGDRLHWTGIDQNWNYQCADCHSTHLLKNFDAAHQYLQDHMVGHQCGLRSLSRAGIRAPGLGDKEGRLAARHRTRA